MDNSKMTIGMEEFCKTLGIGKNTAYKLLTNNEVNAFKIGNIWKIPVSSVEDYINRKCDEQKRTICKIVK